jgi:hypothetical protein
LLLTYQKAFLMTSENTAGQLPKHVYRPKARSLVLQEKQFFKTMLLKLE